MRVLVTGATGFIGRATTLALLREGHEVVAWVRSVERARGLLGAEPTLLPLSAGAARALEGADAVIHLAGEPVLGRRWSARQRRALVASRVDATRELVAAMRAQARPPAVLVSASAVGYYGDRGDELLDEASAPGSDFLATLCQDWERVALEAEAAGTRVVALRIGLVLGRGGGALARMLPLFRAGLGGPLGGGGQHQSWIHLHDLVAVILRALEDGALRGPVNATAPEPVTSRELARELGRVLGRPSWLRVPAWVLRIAIGAGARVLCASQRVTPRRLLELGFRFEHGELRLALAELAGEGEVTLAPLGDLSALAGSPYLEARRPRRLLSARTVLDAPVDEVFAYFSRPENLGAMTPSEMSFRIRGEVGPLGAGSRIDYQIRLGPLPLRWRTRIEAWEAGQRFVDTQERGPYRAWWHEHRLRADGERTVMEDRVLYALPLGPLGWLAHRLFVARALRAIFAFRADAIRLRFGARLTRGLDGSQEAGTKTQRSLSSPSREYS
jgi:hypothetical protein